MRYSRKLPLVVGTALVALLACSWTVSGGEPARALSDAEFAGQIAGVYEMGFYWSAPVDFYQPEFLIIGEDGTVHAAHSADFGGLQTPMRRGLQGAWDRWSDNEIIITGIFFQYENPEVTGIHGTQTGVAKSSMLMRFDLDGLYEGGVELRRLVEIYAPSEDPFDPAATPSLTWGERTGALGRGRFPDAETAIASDEAAIGTFHMIANPPIEGARVIWTLNGNGIVSAIDTSEFGAEGTDMFKSPSFGTLVQTGELESTVLTLQYRLCTPELCGPSFGIHGSFSESARWDSTLIWEPDFSGFSGLNDGKGFTASPDIDPLDPDEVPVWTFAYTGQSQRVTVPAAPYEGPGLDDQAFAEAAAGTYFASGDSMASGPFQALLTVHEDGNVLSNDTSDLGADGGNQSSTARGAWLRTGEYELTALTLHLEFENPDGAGVHGIPAGIAKGVFTLTFDEAFATVSSTSTVELFPFEDCTGEPPAGVPCDPLDPDAIPVSSDDAKLTARRIVATPDPVVIGCEVADIGLDPGAAYGDPMFLRGQMNVWETTLGFVNVGDDTYETRMLMAPAFYQYKVANEGWSIERTNPQSVLSTAQSVTLEPGPAGNSLMWILETGCYQFSLDTTDTDFPVLTLTLAEPDLDRDGVGDGSDNCVAVANADQRDIDGDGIGSACDADLTQNCFVNAEDLGAMKAVFFTPDANADLNGDGVVNFLDLGVAKEHFLADYTADNPSGVPNLCDGS